MDPLLKEMCLDVIADKVNEEKFAVLLLESGLELDDVEWKIAVRLLGEVDRMMYIAETHAPPTLLQ